MVAALKIPFYEICYRAARNKPGWFARTVGLFIKGRGAGFEPAAEFANTAKKIRVARFLIRRAIFDILFGTEILVILHHRYFIKGDAKEERNSCNIFFFFLLFYFFNLTFGILTSES